MPRRKPLKSKVNSVNTTIDLGLKLVSKRNVHTNGASNEIRDQQQNESLALQKSPPKNENSPPRIEIISVHDPLEDQQQCHMPQHSSPLPHLTNSTQLICDINIESEDEQSKEDELESSLTLPPRNLHHVFEQEQAQQSHDTPDLTNLLCSLQVGMFSNCQCFSLLSTRNKTLSFVLGLPTKQKQCWDECSWCSTLLI